MSSFVVLRHDEEPAAKWSEKTVFVRDAFSVFALALPVVWLFWNRLWILGIGALLAFVLVSTIAVQSPVYAWIPMGFSILFSLLVALEGPAWRIAAFQKSGYQYSGVVEAESLENAQLAWLARQPESVSAPTETPVSFERIQYDDDLIFSTSGNG